ncbi:MAG: hypothetical protein H6Q78_857 [Candidatus Krumholzibacteriota bacterium]|nr:hypothetical protein [Candidatus Krumholzibacteriota bacterium]
MKSRAFVASVAIAVLALSVSGCLWAPDLDRVRKDIEKQIPGASFDREFALSLGPVALTLVRGALYLSPEAKEPRDYVRDVRSVRVAVYSVRSLPADFEVRLPAALGKLVEKDGWEVAVKTREGGEAVWILCKEDGGAIDGIYVVALDDNELVLVNAAGRIDEICRKAMRENGGPGRIVREVHDGFGKV